MTISAALDREGWGGNAYLGSDTSFAVPYIIYTTDLSEGMQAILDSGVLPSRGSLLLENAYLAAKNLTLKRDKDNPLIWRAVVTFAPDSLSAQEKEKQDIPDPTARPAEIEWDAVSYTKVAKATEENYTPLGSALIEAGTPVTNSALDPYDPPAEITDYRWTASFAKYVSVVPTWILRMAGRVNNAPYTIDGIDVGPLESRLIGLRIGKRQRDNGVDYRELKGTIEFRDRRESRYEGDKVPEPYVLEIMDEGYNVNILGQYNRIKVPNSATGTTGGNPAPVATKLNGNGGILVDPTFNNTVYRPHMVYRTGDFSQLPLT